MNRELAHLVFFPRLALIWGVERGDGDMPYHTASHELLLICE
jgi:hypothetical protein